MSTPNQNAVAGVPAATSFPDISAETLLPVFEPDEPANIRDLLAALAKAEKRRCDEKYGEYHSLHEAYGVLLEELEEQDEEAAAMRNSLDDMWTAVKNDRLESAEESARELIVNAVNCATECLQIISACMRFHDFAAAHGEKRAGKDDCRG